MQITAELDNQHIEKLQALEKSLKKNTSELISFAIDEIYNKKTSPTEGEKILGILQKTGYLGSMPDVADLSENYKDYLDWSDKAWSLPIAVFGSLWLILMTTITKVQYKVWPKSTNLWWPPIPS